MKVAVFGGNLQGTEAAYLAKKAGWEVWLFDKRATAPAAGICDRFEQLHVADGNRPDTSLVDIDFIIPAFEDENALHTLCKWGEELKTPVAFDPSSYRISSSKKNSNLLFEQLGLNVPQKYPENGSTFIAKPDRASGSQGVHILKGKAAVDAFVQNIKPEQKWVLQEFVRGPSYSVEVMGRPGHYKSLQVTDLFVDERFDCKRVIAPTNLPPEVRREFKQIAIAIADRLNLTGIMDVEVIFSENKLKLLEIDARLPSQTPTAVLWSTGINMVELLADVFVEGYTAPKHGDLSKRYVLYEHIRIDGNTLKVGGEHLMSQAAPLSIFQDFFGADEVISTYQKGNKTWVATMIYASRDRASLLEKKRLTIERIVNKFNISNIIDQ